jgi:hypothetical protein
VVLKSRLQGAAASVPIVDQLPAPAALTEKVTDVGPRDGARERRAGIVERDGRRVGVERDGDGCACELVSGSVGDEHAQLVVAAREGGRIPRRLVRTARRRRDVAVAAAADRAVLEGHAADS